MIKEVGYVGLDMAQTIRVPDPVYERVVTDAERQDVPHGVIVRDWMQTYDEVTGDE